MEDLINVVVRSIGAVLWGLVLFRSMRDDKDDQVFANRPRRRMLYAVVFAYSAMLVVGGLYGAGYLHFVPVPALYATVSAASTLGAISILISPDATATQKAVDEAVGRAMEKQLDDDGE